MDLILLTLIAIYLIITCYKNTKKNYTTNNIGTFFSDR